MSDENLSPISKNANPSWVEKYATGTIDNKTKQTSEYNSKKFEYQQSTAMVGKIIMEGNNSSVKPLLFSKNIPPTEPLNEQFTCKLNENFLPIKNINMLVLIIFLIIIWIIYFIAN